MDEGVGKLDLIIHKINDVLARYIDLEESYSAVLTENAVLKQKEALQKEELISLNNKLKDFNLAHSINSNNNDNAALKMRIDEFVKEIDKCMAMLNH